METPGFTLKTSKLCQKKRNRANQLIITGTEFFFIMINSSTVNAV